MTRALIVRTAGQGVTIQDQGRPGFLAFGLSRGGAADQLALSEGAALLGQAPNHAALEMAGIGGTFQATADIRIALTGAPMRARIDGVSVVWNASHLLPKGAQLVIGGTNAGTYGYLHVGGGFQTPTHLDGKGAHLAAGIGQAVQPGDELPVGPDSKADDTGLTIDADPRFDGGTIRIVPSLQTAFFDPAEIKRFEASEFRRDAIGNRMGVHLVPDGKGFQSQAGLSVVSEVIVPGDIQITGDGTPFVLLSECQTTGGYPRIGCVLPADLPRVAQARPGCAIRFRFMLLEDAVVAERREDAHRKSLRSNVRPLIRDPHDIADLLSYQLISGVTAGNDLDQ